MSRCVKAVLAVLLGTASMVQGERLYEIEVRVVSCKDMRHPNYKLQQVLQSGYKQDSVSSLGYLLYDGVTFERSDISPRFQTSVVYTNSYTGPNGETFTEQLFQGQLGARALHGEDITIKMVNRNPFSFVEYPMGEATFALPTQSQLIDTAFDKARFGIGRNFGQTLTLDLMLKPHPLFELNAGVNLNEPFGSCSVVTRLTATSCLANEFVHPTSVHCSLCAPGFKCDGKESVACPVGTYSDEPSSLCKPCDAGFLCPAMSTSSAPDGRLCGPGTWSSPGATVCSQCPEGRYSDGTEPAVSEECQGQCLAGYRCKAGSTRPDAEPCSNDDPEIYCPPGTGTEVLKAASGEFTTGIDASRAVATEICPKGHACRDGVKKPCPAGEYQDEEGKSACKKCAAGFYGDGTEPAVSEECQGPCLAGYRCKAGSTRPDAEPCSYGDAKVYCPLGTGTEILKAASGEFTTGIDASRAVATEICPKGHACRDGVKTPCPAGEYQDEMGKSSCKKCADGYYSDGTKPAVLKECQGPCLAGYRCKAGSTRPDAEPCSNDDPKVYCPLGTGTEVLRAAPGEFTTGIDASRSVTTEICPTGHACEDGVKTPCPADEYQDEEGKSACKPCTGICGSGEYISQCGGSTAPVCAACSITSQNRESRCTSLTVFIGCDGNSFSDSSRCLSCSNYTMSGNTTVVANGTVVYANATDREFEVACANAGNEATEVVTNIGGLPVWAIAVTALGVALVFVAIIFCIVRKRQQLRRELEALDRKNKSFENDQDLAITMNNNINPIFSKINPDGRIGREAAEKIHLEEMEEVNKRKRALEDELRRLKKEAQQGEVARSTVERSSMPKAKKKEFAVGDVAFQ